jgi:hypothetical protein
VTGAPAQPTAAGMLAALPAAMQAAGPASATEYSAAALAW